MFVNLLKFISLVALTCVAGCASTPIESAPVEEPKVVAVTDETGLPYELGELNAQKLELGDCGLFLFASRPEPRFVFFGEAGKGTAKIVLNGSETTLIRSDVSGDVLDLHYTEQVYTAPIEGVELRVTINEAESVEGGSQISKASIRMSSPEGWKMVIPVGGATSCRNS
ncbi:hypothetical protein [Hirschia litorea]|uniref:Lipoprotein n=1 Tax=Hirschia litorea TaxID=1199156 RepID=A0ABW2IHA1_9PROT